MKNIITGCIKLGCFILLLILVSGCVSKNSRFVSLRHDDQVKQSFENFIVPEGYNFYYFGSISNPEAFVGISKDFKLDASMWEPIELTSDILRDWIWRYANRLKGDMRQFGSNIVGPNMEHIGIWYSLGDWKQWARIELTGDNAVKIGSPISYRRSGDSLFPF